MAVSYQRLTEKELDTFIEMRVGQLLEEGRSFLKAGFWHRNRLFAHTVCEVMNVWIKKSRSVSTSRRIMINTIV